MPISPFPHQPSLLWGVVRAGPIAAATSVGCWLLSQAVLGLSPMARIDWAFLIWEGWQTVLVNSLGVLAFWMAMFELRDKSRTLRREASAFVLELLPEDSQTVVEKESIPQLFKRLAALTDDQRALRLPRAVELCLTKFQMSQDVGEVAGTVQMFLDNEANRADAGYAMVRYLAWAIPSIGFIGTVMGLSSAIGFFGGGLEMKELMSKVSSSLMLAFNTTFVALSLAVVLMYVYHRVTEREEGLNSQVSEYCLRYFVSKAVYAPRG